MLSSLSDVVDGMTKNRCPLCGERHPSNTGITLFIREFVCPNCATTWKDLWCVDCNDRCPTCNTEVEPQFNAGDLLVFEEAEY
jgi:hypothetical protein